MKKLKKKKIRENFFEIYFFRFSKIFFRRNLSYDEQITHAKLYDHRSRGSGATRADRHTQDEDLLYRYFHFYSLLLVLLTNPKTTFTYLMQHFISSSRNLLPLNCSQYFKWFMSNILQPSKILGMKKKIFDFMTENS